MAMDHGVTRLLDDGEATRALGAELARSLAPGAVLLLVGELGAGKTTLVQGLTAALGVREAVTSPTFALCNVYPSGLGEIHHYDLYRLRDPREVPALGLEESLSEAALILIEWPLLALPLLRGEVLLVRLEHAGDRRRAHWCPVAADKLESGALEVRDTKEDDAHV
jgi:tRNA threonylcarbamoyladenosine biosynthesis protein TsaE